MKKIVNVFLFLIIFFSYYSDLYSWFIVCDSWNINLSWMIDSEICDWWYQSNNIEKIESFTWSFSNVNSWYWWNKNADFGDNNIEENLPAWFFDLNKKTKISIESPEYLFHVWFIWTANKYLNNVNIKENLPVWFYDQIRTTKTINSNPEYNFPVWYFWNNQIIVENKKSGRRAYNPIIKITYKDYFEAIFKKYTRLKYIKWWHKHYEVSEYDKLVYNLVYLFSKWNEDYNKVVPQMSKNRIEWHIENNPEFKEKLWLLVLNLREINYAFDNTTNDVQKFYIVDYYLNK